MKTDLKKPEVLLTKQKPSRSPKLSARASFIQEKNFHATAYSGMYDITEEFVDFNYQHPFYGKIGSSGLPILVNQDNLTQVKDISNSIFLLNFVTDALQDFLAMWSRLKRQGKVIDDGAVYNLSPVNGFQDVISSYIEFVEIHKEKLFSFIEDRNYATSIKDLKTFVKVFCRFIDVHTPFLPFSLSFFNISKFFDVRGSGIVLDFSEDDKSIDKNKIDKWIRSPNFSLYKNTLEFYGFSIEKNTPWRIVANIDSIKMKEYMKIHRINKDNFFNIYFNNINLIELDIYKKIIINFYKEYINKKPKIEISKSKICNNRTKVERSTIERKKEIDLDQQVWLRIYLFTRAREINANWTQEEFDKIAENCSKLKKNVDLAAAMTYFEKKISKIAIAKRKNRNFRF